MSLATRNAQLGQKLAKILERKNISSEFSLDFDAANLPIDIANSFSSYHNFILEIGSGWGEFTLANAKNNPDSLIIALEKKKKRISRCIKNQKKAEIKNIRWMVVDVDWFFDELFLPSTFNKVIINFPDPWPKKKHHKHRFLGREFMQTLSTITRPNAELEFATDFWPYMQEGLINIVADKKWKNVNGPGVVVKEIAGRPQSYFEQLKRSEGEHVYFSQFKKNLS